MLRSPMPHLQWFFVWPAPTPWGTRFSFRGTRLPYSSTSPDATSAARAWLWAWLLNVLPRDGFAALTERQRPESVPNEESSNHGAVDDCGAGE